MNQSDIAKSMDPRVNCPKLPVLTDFFIMALFLAGPASKTQISVDSHRRPSAKGFSQPMCSEGVY